jgi:hypothetical protein
MYSELILFAVILLIIAVAAMITRSGKKQDREAGSAATNAAESDKLPSDSQGTADIINHQDHQMRGNSRKKGLDPKKE